MRIPGWMFLVGLLGFIASTALCATLAFTTARQFSRDSLADELPTFAPLVIARATSTALPTSTDAPPTNTPPPGVTFTPAPTEAPTIEPTFDPLGDVPEWEDPRRITVLLMGIDQRSAVEGEEDGPFRTDTMIVVQIDPVRERIGVLSIPRDLWVDIPGFQAGRITTANYLGDGAELPQGGPGLAMETVRRNLGVSVDHYIRINFNVFTSIVDTIAPDGVEVCVDEQIIDENYPDEGYGTIRVQFDPGCEDMNAERLLQYARTRATEGSDFDRNQRQQQVLQAVQREVLSAGGILNFIGAIPTLYDDLRVNYVTSLDLDDILSLARLVSGISQDAISFGAIGIDDVTFDNTADGSQQILLPIQSEIAREIQETFNPRETDLTQADLRTRAEGEAAQIYVYNNTDIPGLAGQTRDWLNSRQVDVTDVGNVLPSTNENTTIRDYGGNNFYTVRYLAALLGLPETQIIPGTDDALESGVMIAVGPDVQGVLSGGGAP